MKSTSIQRLGECRFYGVFLLTLIFGAVIDVFGADVEPLVPPLHLALSFEEVRFEGRNSKGIAEFLIRPRIEIQYRPSGLNATQRALKIPVLVGGDRFCFARDGYENFQLIDPDGVEVKIYKPEWVWANSMLLLYPRKTISCSLDDGFGAEVKRVGIYRLSIRVVLTDDEGKKLEADVSGSFKVDAIPDSKSVK